MVFSDYGQLLPYSRLEVPEFQTYGTSVAVGLNFPQIAAACAALPGFRFHAPAGEEGSLITRVLQRAPGPDLTAPVEAAREVLRGRMYERARGYCAAALELEPRNWALLQEIAVFLLIPNGEHAAALDMVDLGLALNPLAADLCRARGEALLALDRLPEAAAALDRAVALAPSNAAAHRLRAEAALRAGRHADALAAVAAALAEDRAGDAQEALLALQTRVLADIARLERDRLLVSANPFLARDGLPQG